MSTHVNNIQYGYTTIRDEVTELTSTIDTIDEKINKNISRIDRYISFNNKLIKRRTWINGSKRRK